MGHSWVSIAAWGFLALALVSAWAFGGWAERIGALLLLFSNSLSDIAMALYYPHTPQLILFSLDFLLAIGLLAVALRYGSIWLGAAMMLQSIALCAHAFRLGGYLHDQFWWMVLNNVISQLMLVCIIVATAASWRARRKGPPTAAFIVVSDAPAH